MKWSSVCASWFFCFSSGNTLHCIGLLKEAALKFAVFCCSATLMWRRRKVAGNCLPLLIFVFLWSETLFAQVHCFAFLQSRHSTALLCYQRPPWSLPSFAAVQRWCEGEEQEVITPPYYYCFFKRTSVLLASSFFCFSSVKAPHWITLLPMATLKFAVFCCSATLI